MTVKSIIIDLKIMHLAKLCANNPKFNGVFGGSGHTSGLALIVFASDFEQLLTTNDLNSTVTAVLTIAYRGEAPEPLVIKFINDAFPGILDRLLA